MPVSATEDTVPTIRYARAVPGQNRPDAEEARQVGLAREAIAWSTIATFERRATVFRRAAVIGAMVQLRKLLAILDDETEG